VHGIAMLEHPQEKMTMTPEPTDKLDATTYVAVNGPADDALLNDERIVRPHATGPRRLA